LTGDGRVRSGKREGGGGMIERRWLPGRGVMALRARVRQHARHMIGTRGRGEISRVTRVTVRGRAAVVSGGSMALSAQHGHVRAGQGECCSRMIERGRSPVVRRVTRLARDRESARNVSRIGGAGEIRLMARVARGRGAASVAGSRMALLAVYRGVETR
jgi:hypothetical protein